MISITSYAKGKKSSQSSGNGGGGGFANAQIYNNGFNPFYLWGQYIDGRDSINGDLISNGTINGNKFVGQQGNIDLIYALSEYVNYISGHTAIFDNLSGDTAHFNQDVFVGGDMDIVGDTNITGDTTIYGDLAVSGDTHLKNVWTQNINNSDTIKTKNLEVTGLAHFFQLVIDRIKAAGGAILLTPADGFETALVEEDASGYTLYFHAKDGEKQISNMWEVNDQAICQTFNASTGTSYNVSNTYYWALVTEVSEQAVQKTVSGVTEEYHYIKLSKSVYDGELNPKVGDEIAMLGSRNDEDPQRQSAIYMAAYTSLDQGLTAPCFAEYKGINDFSLSSHRHSYIDATGASFTGDFRIDNNTTIQDYVNSATTEIRNEFRFDTEGLYSRVSKMTNPNILPANGWTDQDDKALLQEDDEEYIFEEPQQQSMAKGGFSEDVVSEDLIGMPPIIYLNADTYTFSIYSQVKFEDIQYGYTKDNLNMTLPVQTAFNSGDTWHSQARAITTFYAPINGYYHLGAKIMGSDYTGDYEWVDPDGESGYTPTESGITTSIEISMQNNKVIASVTPSDFNGTITWQSSNPTACTIDQEGNLTVLTTGSTVITASIPEQYHNGKHYLGSNDTLNLDIEYLQINYTDLPSSGLTEGDSHSLNASTNPTGGTLSYVSSNPVVAGVDSNGVITAFSHGSTTIAVTSEGFTDNENNIIYADTTAYVTVDVNKHVIDSNYFVIYANEATTFTVLMSDDARNSISYRKNGSGNWTTVSYKSSADTFTNISMAQGDYLEMKGTINNDVRSFRFRADPNGRITASGYLMALAKNTEITDSNNSYGYDWYSFGNLFSGCTALISAEDVIMPSDTSPDCFFAMFRECTNLTKAPYLPSITLSNSCYQAMFLGCTSLTSLSVGFTEIPDDINNLYAWLNDIPTTGTLYAPTNAEYSDEDEDLNLPSGWTLSKTLDPTPQPVWSISAQTISYTPLPSSAMTKGTTHNLNASTNAPINTVAYSSNNPSVANVNYQGVLSAKTNGIATITIDALAYDDNVNYVHYTAASTSFDVGVYSSTAQTILYTALPSSGLTEGETHSLNASAQGALSYGSTYPEIASVDSNGVISGISTGSTIISISADAYYDGYIYYPPASTSITCTVQASAQPFNPLTDSKYFVIQARSATTLTIESVSSPTGTTAYRKNGVGEWTTANIDANTDISLAQGDYLEFKGNINHANNKYYRFKTSVAKSIDCGGWLAALEKNAEIEGYRFEKTDSVTSTDTITVSKNNPKCCAQYYYTLRNTSNSGPCLKNCLQWCIQKLQSRLQRYQCG